MISPDIAVVAHEAQRWLFTDLLPFWAAHGIYPSGGFVEQIGRGGALALPLRLRVQARQIYVFAEAGRLGWSGPWRDVMGRGLAFLLEHYLRPDGLVRSKVSEAGECLDDHADNYDQAFAVFALANAYDIIRTPDLEACALRLIDRLWQERKHPELGFHEANPPIAPLCANPHMHLFEACQAWARVSDNVRWRDLANEIVQLCATRLVEPTSGSLHEFFELDWSIAAGERGRIVEPGHEFEWAWLLRRWAELTGDVAPPVAQRLYDHARAHGLTAHQTLTINAVDAEGRVIDPAARLWPQTERIKAALIMGDATSVVQAWSGLQSYCYVDNPALYVDLRGPDGAAIDGPAYASSLYHITCAISELVRLGGA